MIKSLKLFAACVESLRTAEKEYEQNPTAFNKNIVEGLRNKTDGWIAWVHQQTDAGLERDVPPFIGKQAGRDGDGDINPDVLKRLRETHSEADVQKFISMMRGQKGVK